MIWTPRVTVAALIYHQERYLLLVEEEDNDCLVLNQPAGHLEKNESLLQAVIRETAEETGGQLTPTSFVGIYRWQHPQHQLTFLRFCIAGTLNDPEAALHPQDKDIINVHWLSYDEILNAKTRLRSPLVLQCIEDFKAGQHYPLEVYHDFG